MAYTLKELGSTELASMYQEYLRLSDMLRDGEIDQIEALRRVEDLSVEDNYHATWTVDPNSATFVMTDANGVRTADADPRMYQPADSTKEADYSNIPEYEYKPKVSEAPISFASRKMVWWKKLLIGGGAVVGAFLLFTGGMITHMQTSPDPAPVPVEVERPVVEGEGPSAERMLQVFDQLGSGDMAKVKYVVPNETDDDMLRWATSVLGAMRADGHRLQQVRTEEGISVLQVVDSSDRVVMQGDLTWVQDAGGAWVLDEIPLMGPADTKVEVTPVETPAPEPSDGGGEGSEAPADEPTDQPSKKPEK